MSTKLHIYNTLKKEKEVFVPINEQNVGMYVCGPTVYGDPHLGHARSAITFDLVFRYLQYLGYKVRYVRNITDVGHLAGDADDGEDKIAKQAKLDKLEPMEVVQHYTNRYHESMRLLNTLPPSIEPSASGHIIEQQEMIDQILASEFAYEVNGSVYFDVQKYNKQHKYGKLSGRIIEDLYSNTRALDGQDEKRNSYDFSLWKKAKPEHLMKWPSKWSQGYPGWHLECSVMSTKYLGKQFDIHGGGLDLLFPHHECEIAQSTAANGQDAVKYWMHNNMITINGQKMGKSLGNSIMLEEFFTGKHDALERAYSPMVIRFFILSSHYRKPLDFSNEALQAAEKGFQRLFNGIKTLDKLNASDVSSVDINVIIDQGMAALNDDFNTPILFSQLFDGVRLINSAYASEIKLCQIDIDKLKKFYQEISQDVLGLLETEGDSDENNAMKEVVNLLLNLRQEAKINKNFALSDQIRNELTKLGFEIKDGKDGFEWEFKSNN